MAKKIYELSVKMGNVIPVVNQEKKGTEAEVYNCVKVEDEDGGNERYLLFTDTDLKTFPKVLISINRYIFNDFKDLSTHELIDKMKYGRIYKTTTKDVTGEWVTAHLVKVRLYNKNDAEFDTTILRLPPSKLERAETRSDHNPEDLCIVSWFQDLID